ncbi:MAG: NAD(P)-dependent oxidoreductase [Deltaproteobacteria bacterium]|nr:NAD(P)-dependent oxidoreductase [Deltaproteobacteria bacterium]
MKILITGAAGNLGSLLARSLLQESTHTLNLMYHTASLAQDLLNDERTHTFQCDLGNITSLQEVCEASDVIVHFAGVLFAPQPEKFLHKTNFEYAKNLIDAAITAKVKRFVLISFPHVEGPTSQKNPCTNQQDKNPISAHATTRLKAEKYLFEACQSSAMQPISLRAGMIYGKDILMVAFAKKLALIWLLGIWRKPTAIHLLSIDDFLACCKSAIENPHASGIYPLGDDAPITLQNFLDEACQKWRCKKPWRVPLWSVYTVAWLCERFAQLFATKTPFTKDLIKIGSVPYYCNTQRMKEDLLPKLKYPSFHLGKDII